MAKKPSADTTLVHKAITLVTALHADQFKYGERIPYLSHIFSVARLVGVCSQEPEVMAAALLHDSIEKGGVTGAGIEKQFTKRVREIVEGLTEPQEGDWQSKKKSLLHFLEKKAGNDQLLIACADKSDNLFNLVLLRAAIGKEWEKKAGATMELLEWYHESALGIFSKKAMFRKKAPSTLLVSYTAGFRELFSPPFG